MSTAKLQQFKRILNLCNCEEKPCRTIKNSQVLINLPVIEIFGELKGFLLILSKYSCAESQNLLSLARDNDMVNMKQRSFSPGCLVTGSKKNTECSVVCSTLFPLKQVSIPHQRL